MLLAHLAEYFTLGQFFETTAIWLAGEDDALEEEKSSQVSVLCYTRLRDPKLAVLALCDVIIPPGTDSDSIRELRVASVGGDEVGGRQPHFVIERRLLLDVLKHKETPADRVTVQALSVGYIPGVQNRVTLLNARPGKLDAVSKVVELGMKDAKPKEKHKPTALSRKIKAGFAAAQSPKKKARLVGGFKSVAPKPVALKLAGHKIPAPIAVVGPESDPEEAENEGSDDNNNDYDECAIRKDSDEEPPEPIETPAVVKTPDTKTIAMDDWKFWSIARKPRKSKCHGCTAEIPGWTFKVAYHPRPVSVVNPDRWNTVFYRYYQAESVCVCCQGIRNKFPFLIS